LVPRKLRYYHQVNRPAGRGNEGKKLDKGKAGLMELSLRRTGHPQGDGLGKRVAGRKERSQNVKERKVIVRERNSKLESLPSRSKT